MRKILMLTFVCALFCSRAQSTPIPCVNGTLASYEALDATGCLIGTNVFSSFDSLSGILGATELAPSSVSITPSGGNGNPQLLFSVSGNAAAGDLLETIFTYMISGNGYLQARFFWEIPPKLSMGPPQTSRTFARAECSDRME
jgi:hypothetical protein